MGGKRRWLIGLSMVLLVSCVTVNIYFPAAAIQKAADQIVEDVRKTPEPAPSPTPEPKPDKSSALDRVWVVRLGPAEAQAAAVDVNVSTPGIRNIRASLASRFPPLQPLYAKGAIGETNAGLIAARDIGALSLKEKADLNRLVERENADRQALYAEIIRANNLDPGQLGEVQRLFANSWRDQSAAGWWVQQNNGQWGRK